jgi:hypothetical protein
MAAYLFSHTAGWTDIDALVGPYTFQYYDPVFSRNGGTPNGYYGLYSTDVVAEKALSQIKAGVQAQKPFYAQAGHKFDVITCFELVLRYT